MLRRYGRGVGKQVLVIYSGAFFEWLQNHFFEYIGHTAVNVVVS